MKIRLNFNTKLENIKNYLNDPVIHLCGFLSLLGLCLKSISALHTSKDFFPLVIIPIILISIYSKYTFRLFKDKKHRNSTVPYIHFCSVGIIMVYLITTPIVRFNISTSVAIEIIFILLFFLCFYGLTFLAVINVLIYVIKLRRDDLHKKPDASYYINMTVKIIVFYCILLIFFAYNFTYFPTKSLTDSIYDCYNLTNFTKAYGENKLYYLLQFIGFKIFDTLFIGIIISITHGFINSSTKKLDETDNL